MFGNGQTNEVLLRWSMRMVNPPAPENSFPAKNLNYFLLWFNDESLAQRVRTAFLHAAHLCKGNQAF